MGTRSARLGTGEPVTVGIRPEHLGLKHPGDVAVEGTIILVEYLGSELFVYAKLADGESLLAQAPGNAPFKRGAYFA
ncbi:TOBE domain-containing protein [Devosia marina]|uniref:TOBE domain-containing protein n=1 Tax=Devosia marina TaxID=2683198 RepID=UPI0012FC6389|nr:TOBE domain-containing protein [Devosia marina]